MTPFYRLSASTVALLSVATLAGDALKIQLESDGRLTVPGKCQLLFDNHQ